MSIIITTKGGNAKRLGRSVIPEELQLQDYISQNPEVIPVHEIQEDLRLLILAREFYTYSGPIDALGVDQNGALYIIETKLFKNTDKRRVLAQVLDYGASLYKRTDDTEAFLTQLNAHCEQRFEQSLEKKLQSQFGINLEQVQALTEAMATALEEGQFRFVVLMDHIDDRLKDLITFVNEKSGFDIYGVELDFYRHQENEIVIPRLLGAEVKKEVMRASSRGIPWNKDRFFTVIEDSFEEDQADALRIIYEQTCDIADAVLWGKGKTYGSFQALFHNLSTSVASYIVYSNGYISLQFGGLPETPVTKERIQQVIERAREIEGLEMSEDDRQRYPSISIEIWGRQINNTLRMLRAFINS